MKAKARIFTFMLRVLLGKNTSEYAKCIAELYNIDSLLYRKIAFHTDGR